MLGWSCDVDVKIAAAGPAGETLKSHLEWFSKQGGSVFAMVWKNTIFESVKTKDAVTFVNVLRASAGHAVLDAAHASRWGAPPESANRRQPHHGGNEA